jgi:peptidoglycan hydrolase CwlO-like protein
LSIHLEAATEYPIAASIFLERQGVTPIVVHQTILEPTPVTPVEPSSNSSIPSDETMEALNGAFLNLNRSGLMMNKLFKFLDRVPTMKTLDEEFVNELTNSLSEAELIIKKAERDLSLSQKEVASLRSELEAKSKEYDRLGRENKYLATQNDLLHHEIEALKDELNALKLQVPIPVNATTTATKTTKVGTKTYKRPKAKELPPKPLRFALPPSN